MKKIILYPPLFTCLSILFFLTGCEREEIVSDRIALNALKVQLGVTRASDGGDPTLTTPDDRPDWVLEVQIEGGTTENYVFSKADKQWIPRSNPACFPAGINTDGYQTTFTLRPPAPSNTITGQDSEARLLTADTLTNTLKMKPQTNYSVLLAHANSLIEVVFEHSLENRAVEITLQGNLVHHYSIDHRRYLCIVPSGSNRIILTAKEDAEERQYELDITSGTKSNTRYVFTATSYVFTVTGGSISIHSPVISPWSNTETNAIIEEEFDAKEFIHIEGYAGVISFMVSDTFVRLYSYPGSKGKSTYYFPPTVLKNKKIDSLLLEEHSKNILIGRTISDINPVNLKVDSHGKPLLRKAGDGTILINTVDELLLVNTDLESNYKQESDLDLSCISPRSWEPVGNFESPFKGTYDGNGYVIHSLNIDIKQFTAWNPDQLDNPNVISDNASYWALPAGAVGMFGVNQGTIHNVHIASGMMSVSEIQRESMKSIAFGAVCGYNDGGYIAYCTNKAELKVHTISSAVDNNRWDKSDIFTVGGICGTSRGSIEYSINYSDIITENGFFAELVVGGICGNLYSRYQTDIIKINSCINYGDMLCNDLSFLTGEVSFRYFGGIAGVMYYLDSSSIGGFRETIQQVSNCYNTGSFLEGGTKEFFGIYSGIVACMYYPRSAYSSKISSCYNRGEMTIQNHVYEMRDPVICMVYELNEYLPFKFPIENCFYNATTTWKDIRDMAYEHYYPVWYAEHGADNDLKEYVALFNRKVVEIPGFSLDSWPTSDLWGDDVWGDLGSWNNGKPVYPKLRFEKD